MSRGKRTYKSLTVDIENKKSKIEPVTMSGGSTESNPKLVFTNMNDNRYNENSSAPFIIYVFDKNPNKNLGNLHEFTLSRELRPIKQHIQKIKPLGNNKVMIFCYSYKDANLLVESKISEINENWGAVIPDSRVQIIGVINNIPIELNDEEIISLIKSSDSHTKAFKTERIKKRDPDTDMTDDDQINLIPTLLVKVFFRELVLPKSIVIDCVERKVRHYIPKVRRCYKCLRFGHLKDQCKGKMRCANCLGEHDAKGCKEETSPCVNCGSFHHNSMSLICPQFKKEQQILKIKYEQNLSFPEARNRVIVRERENTEILNINLNESRRSSQYSINGSTGSGDSGATVTTINSVIKNDNIPKGHFLFNMNPLVKTEIGKFIDILKDLSIGKEEITSIIHEAEVRYHANSK